MARKETGKQMISAAEMEKQLAADAQREYDGEKSGGGLNISIRGSVFRMNGEDLGDEMNVVVVDSSYEHAYYDSPYNPDDPQPPACFAVSHDEDEMAPHEDSPAPQADTCAECWANEWGSSQTGRGRACKNSRRLALLAVGDDGVAFGEMPLLRVPPASLRNYSGYAKRSTKVTGRPTYGLITKVGFDENADYETLTFELVGKVDSQEDLQGILEMRPTAEDLTLEPFDTSNYTSPEEVSRKRRTTGKKTTVKKKVAKKKATARRSKMS